MTTDTDSLMQGRDFASRLFSHFLGDAQPTMKSAARMARALEEQFIVDGWPLGRIYGSALELGRRYGVGRAAAWEAIRVLEARGTARMRCGKGGGLELTSPSIERVCERIVGYCLLSGVTYDQVRVFMEVLQRMRLRARSEGFANNPIIAFYEECISQLNKVSETEVRNDKPHNSADLIVNDLFQRIGVARWSEGLFLGNQTELCDRYKVDSRTLRQAIRILESVDAAVTVPGRGHGLMARAPGPASTSRLICCYFAANSIDPQEAFQAFNWLSTEAMSLAASSSMAQSLNPIGTMLAEFRGLAGMTKIQTLMAIEERQLALAGNVVLDLFLRSCKAFPVWRPFSYKALEPMVEDLFSCAVAVQTALTANDATAAALAQTRKFTIVDRNLRSHVPEYSQRISAHG